MIQVGYFFDAKEHLQNPVSLNTVEFKQETVSLFRILSLTLQ